LPLHDALPISGTLREVVPDEDRRLWIKLLLQDALIETIEHRGNRLDPRDAAIVEAGLALFQVRTSGSKAYHPSAGHRLAGIGSVLRKWQIPRLDRPAVPATRNPQPPQQLHLQAAPRGL